MNPDSTNRREWLKQAGAVAAGAAAVGALPHALNAARDTPPQGVATAASKSPSRHLGHIKQSASRWCYSGIPLPELCRAGRRLGLAGIDLLQQAEWDVVNDSGLTVPGALYANGVTLAASTAAGEAGCLTAFCSTSVCTASVVAFNTGCCPTTHAGADSHRPMQGAGITRTFEPSSPGRRSSRSRAPAISHDSDSHTRTVMAAGASAPSFTTSKW